MPDPIVTNILDADGVERWGSVSAKWAVEAAARQKPEPEPVEGFEEETDAAEDAAPGDDPKPTRRKH